MATGAIGEPVKLLFLDAVLHVPAGAIHLVVQVLGDALEVGEDIARVGPAGAMLGLDEDPSWRIPGLRGIGELAEQALLLAAVIEGLPGLRQQRLGPCTQARIAGDADNIVHPMALTPCKHAPAAKAAVAAQGDPHLRPAWRRRLTSRANTAQACLAASIRLGRR